MRQKKVYFLQMENYAWGAQKSFCCFIYKRNEIDKGKLQIKGNFI